MDIHTYTTGINHAYLYPCVPALEHFARNQKGGGGHKISVHLCSRGSVLNLQCHQVGEIVIANTGQFLQSCTPTIINDSSLNVIVHISVIPCDDKVKINNVYIIGINGNVSVLCVYMDI